VLTLENKRKLNSNSNLIQSKVSIIRGKGLYIDVGLQVTKRDVEVEESSALFYTKFRLCEMMWDFMIPAPLPHDLAKIL